MVDDKLSSLREHDEHVPSVSITYNRSRRNSLALVLQRAEKKSVELAPGRTVLTQRSKEENSSNGHLRKLVSSTSSIDQLQRRLLAHERRMYTDSYPQYNKISSSRSMDQLETVHDDRESNENISPVLSRPGFREVKFMTRRTSLALTKAPNPAEENIDRNERIVINVGGHRHETFRSTLKNFPDTRLGWIALNSSGSMEAYDPVKDEYFFDRHPTAFPQILNFYRTGKLHAPADICGPLFEEELNFWGLDEKAMEPCCWPKYTEHRDAQENLKVFDSPELNPSEEDPFMQSSRSSSGCFENVYRFNRLFRAISFLKPSWFKHQKWKKFKALTWSLFEDHATTIPRKIITFTSLTFIVLAVLSLCLHSMLRWADHDDNPSPISTDRRKLFSDLLLGLDIACCAWFTTELFLRLVSCPNRIKFIKQIINWIDLFSVVPYYALFVTHGEFPLNFALELLSMMRMLRLFRFFRLSTGLQILKQTLIASSGELFFFMLVLMIPVALFATVVYFCERDVQSTKFKTIPESFWWALITMTTVGYGDMSPATSVGKVFGAFCAACSVLILALPVSIIGNNFTLFYNYAQARLKLPQRPQNALVGAANALVADQSQHSASPEPGTDDEEDTDGDRISKKIDLESPLAANGNITFSKRYRRERLSLYATSPGKAVGRVTRSASDVKAANRNGDVIPIHELKASFENKNKTEVESDDEETSTTSRPLSAKRTENTLSPNTCRRANSINYDSPHAHDNEAFSEESVPEEEENHSLSNGHVPAQKTSTAPEVALERDIPSPIVAKRSPSLSSSRVHPAVPKTIVTMYNDKENDNDTNNNSRNDRPRSTSSIDLRSSEQVHRCLSMEKAYYSPPVDRKSRHHVNTTFSVSNNKQLTSVDDPKSTQTRLHIPKKSDFTDVRSKGNSNNVSLA